MDARQTLLHGNRWPFDAPDAWWEDGTAPPPQPVDWAHTAARGVIADLKDRRGIKHLLAGLDEEIRAEMVETLAAIIRAAHPTRGE